jgi:pimeloyl-ACP methyl ester carboxylesterase
VLVAFDDGAVFGERWGESPPAVVALHGWRRTHADFARSLGPRSPGGALPVVALDLPGFGASPEPPAPWGSPEYGEVVARVVEGLGAGPVVVVGHSLGGRVAVRLAAKRPELVRGLVLTGAPVAPRHGPPPRPAAAYRVARRLHRLGVLPEALMERARRRHGSADYRAATGVMRQVLVRMVGESYEADLTRLRGPVELVWGDDDTAAPVEGARRLAEALPGARLTVCPGAGHLTPDTVPGELRAAAERLLAGP